MAKKSESSKSQYSDNALRERLKKKIMAGDKGGNAGQWSARKAQLLAAEYKKAGGTYTGSRKTGQKHLKQWTEEKWQTESGSARARHGKSTERYLPKKAWDKLSPAEKKATNAKKKTGSRSGKQFVANTPAAKRARKRAVAKSSCVDRSSPGLQLGVTDLGRSLLILGCVIAVIGGVIYALVRVGFRGLPGDLSYRSSNVQVYFPIVSCIVVSALLTLGVWLFRWFGGR